MTTTVLNPKIENIENKIPEKSSLVTATVLNTKTVEVEIKILGNSIYITFHNFHKVTEEHFEETLKQTDLVVRTNFDNKLISINRRITSNKTKDSL